MLAAAKTAPHRNYSCLGTKASHHFVPSCASKTQVGLQLPPEETLAQNLVSTTRSWAKGLSLAMPQASAMLKKQQN